jgi:hypothetical protein
VSAGRARKRTAAASRKSKVAAPTRRRWLRAIEEDDEDATFSELSPIRAEDLRYLAWSRDLAVGIFSVLPLWLVYEGLRRRSRPRSATVRRRWSVTRS